MKNLELTWFRRHRQGLDQQKGVTLIELLVVVVIIGIIAAIAYPSYQNYVRRGNRAEAKGILLEATQFLERNYTLANRYDLDSGGAALLLPCPLTTAPKSTLVGTVCTPPTSVKYNIAVAFGAAPAQTFTLSATPTGTMTGDACGTLTLDEKGVQGAGGTVADCWGH